MKKYVGELDAVGTSLRNATVAPGSGGFRQARGRLAGEIAEFAVMIFGDAGDRHPRSDYALTGFKTPRFGV